MKQKENLELLILVGVPASGKSTWSKRYVIDNPNWVRVSRDDFREMLKSSPMCENKIEEMISSLVNSTIEHSFSKKMNVIVDATNLNLKYINAFIDRFNTVANINFRIFDISLKKAIEYDSNRIRPVGETIINRFYKQYKDLLDTYSFQPLTKKREEYVIPNFESNKPNAIIFDIDGTLALMGNRSPYDWDKVWKDDVNKIVSEQIEFHKSSGRKIIIVTGRDASCKDITVEWLNYNDIYFDEIFTRPLNDYRKDTSIKREIYENNIKDKYNVLAVFDDRLSVVEEWSKMGLFVFNVNQGNKIF